MNKPSDIDADPVHAVVRQRFTDQLDADECAERFLLWVIQRLDAQPPRPSEIKVKWWNLEHDDGRAGVVSVTNTVVATVTVTRDAMNWSEVCGVAFV